MPCVMPIEFVRALVPVFDARVHGGRLEGYYAYRSRRFGPPR
jgi:hypothetical protein